MGKEMTMLAEITDKLPTVELMWEHMLVIGGILALLTAVATVVSRRAGLVPLVMAGIVSLIVVSPQGSWDDLMVRELGQSYLNQQRLSASAPFALSLVAWLGVQLVAGKRRSGEDSADG